MTQPNAWMPLYVGDYLRDTMGLSREDHGSYLLLLMAYWATGGPLLDHDETLRNIARCPLDQWPKTKAILSQYFVIENGQWINNRADIELETMRQKLEARAEISRLGVNARRKPKKQPTVQPSVIPSVEPTVEPTEQPRFAENTDSSRNGKTQSSFSPESLSLFDQNEPSVQPTVEPSVEPLVEPSVNTSQSQSHISTLAPPDRGAKPAKQRTNTAHLRELWSEAYKKHFDCKYHHTGAKDAKAESSLLTSESVETIISVAQRAWELSVHKNAFWCKQASTLSGLACAWSSIRAEIKVLDKPAPAF